MSFDDDKTIGEKLREIQELQNRLKSQMRLTRFSFLIIGGVIGWLSCRVLNFAMTELQP